MGTSLSHILWLFVQSASCKLHFITHPGLMFMGSCPCMNTPEGAYLFLMAGADVEHGHGAVGCAISRHELLGAHVWGVEGWGGRCWTPCRSHVCGRRRRHELCCCMDRLGTEKEKLSSDIDKCTVVKTETQAICWLNWSNEGRTDIADIHLWVEAPRKVPVLLRRWWTGILSPVAS